MRWMQNYGEIKNFTNAEKDFAREVSLTLLAEMLGYHPVRRSGKIILQEEKMSKMTMEQVNTVKTIKPVDEINLSEKMQNNDVNVNNAEKEVDKTISTLDYLYHVSNSKIGFVIETPDNPNLKTNKGIKAALAKRSAIKKFNTADDTLKKRIVLHFLLSRSFQTETIALVTRAVMGNCDLSVLFQLIMDASSDAELVNGVAVFFDTFSPLIVHRENQADNKVSDNLVKKSEDNVKEQAATSIFENAPETEQEDEPVPPLTIEDDFENEGDNFFETDEFEDYEDDINI